MIYNSTYKFIKLQLNPQFSLYNITKNKTTDNTKVYIPNTNNLLVFTIFNINFIDKIANKNDDKNATSNGKSCISTLLPTSPTNS